MTIFMAERYLPDVTLEQLTALQQTVIKTSQRFNTRGKSVQCLRSLYIPGDFRCLCFFDAPNAKVVQEVNEEAQFPFLRIVSVIELV